MYDPAMNAMNGEKAKSSTAPSATPRRGSAARRYQAKAAAASAPVTGPTIHGARINSPIASSADQPGGNCPKYLPPPSITLASEKNAGSACVGTQSRPPAKIRACIDCTNSSIRIGWPSKTSRAIAAYSASETTETSAATRAGRRSHCSASASHPPSRHMPAMRRDAIASTRPTPTTIQVP